MRPQMSVIAPGQGIRVDHPGWDAAKTLITFNKVLNAVVDARKFICIGVIRCQVRLVIRPVTKPCEVQGP
jgi:hypothetical protein